MSEMIERVARAIFDAADDKVPWDGVPWVELPKEYQDDYRNQARAAIAAMREPTEGMIKAADDSGALNWSLEPGEGLDSISWDVAYRAMVDAALKP